MKYFFLLFPFILTAQITNIKGFVKSESGALGFASISLVNTEFGIISDENGYFELDVNLSKTQVYISFIYRPCFKENFFNK
jgi:hypothetical protein